MYELTLVVVWIVLWLGLSLAAAVVAHHKGGSGVAYFILAAVLSPLIGLILALVARPNYRTMERREIASGDFKKCPECAELVKHDASVCRYCGFRGEFLAPPAAAVPEY